MIDVPVGPAEEIADGSAAVVTVDGERIAVFRVDGEFYALEDRCSHEQAWLSEGEVEGCAVECPLHASTFDLRTGAPSGPPAYQPVRVFATSVVDGIVHVHVEPSAD